MIGLVVGQMDFEEVQAAVDLLDEADLAGEHQHGTDAAIGEAVHALGDFVLGVVCREHGFEKITELGLVEPLFNLPLARLQSFAYGGFHSKSLSRSTEGC